MCSKPISLNIGGGLDYLIGGSPCTYWSIAQKNNRETEASGLGWELFSQYVRALHESEPKFFIYENNKSMSNAIRESITKAFGFEPICINSALVSAQNRQRLYWVGRRNDDGSYSKVKIEQPVDRGILLRDILEYGTWINPTNNSKSRTIHAGMSRLEHNMIPRINHENPAKQQHDCIVEPVNVTSAGKAQCLRATCYKDGIRNMVGNNVDRKTCVAEPVGTTKDGKSYCLTAGYANGSGEQIGNYAAHTLEKGCKSMVAEPVCVGYGNGCGTGTATGSHAIPTDIVPFVIKKYDDAYKKFGYIPEMYNPYNNSEITEKSPTLTAQCNQQTASSTVMVICHAIPIEFDEMGRPTKAVSGSDGKNYIVYEVQSGQITIKEKQYPIKLADGFYIIRKLTVSECKRLQTVPDWYEFPVSDTQAYKMLGNGWTCDVISHLINATLENK